MSNLNMKMLSSYYGDRERLPMGKHTVYSVLVPFVEYEGELYLLFEKRAEGDIKSPGEICFPGGHLEKGESPGRCALRETEEELGIPMERITFIGRGDTLRGFANYTLYTTIGGVSYEDFKEIKPEDEEVAESFLVKVKEFMENEPFVYESQVIANRDDFPYELAGITPDYPWAMGKWDTVIYNVKDMDGNPRIVWGITGGIVRHVISQLTEALDGYR